MKSILLILAMTVTTHAFELIDSKKFQSLSREQQIRYLTEVQKIVVGITKKSNYSAENEKASNRNPASKKPDLDNWDSPKAQFALPPTEIIEPELITKPEPAKTPEPQATVSQSAPATTPKKETPPTATKSKPVAENKAAPSKVKPKKETTHFRCMHTGFVIKEDPCTGFQKIPDWMGIDGVIEKNKSCSAGYSVCNPVLFGLKFDNPDQCKSLLDGECSKTARPFCAQRGMWPTEECHKMATANGNLGTAVAAEINSQIKPSLYEEFKKDMETLCNPEKIKSNPFAEFRNGVKRSDKTAQAVRDDLTQTCAWASKQIDFINAAIVDSEQIKSYESKKPGQK